MKAKNVFGITAWLKEKFPVCRGVEGHSAVFPLELAKSCLTHFSKEGDIVLDPFIGSGTTALACQEMGRNFIGFEICADYCKIAEDRLSKARSGKK